VFFYFIARFAEMVGAENSKYFSVFITEKYISERLLLYFVKL